VVLGAPDASGKRKIQATEDPKFRLETDVVVRAIGQNRRTDLINAFGLVHHHGILAVDPETYQTSNEKIYAAGDVIFGIGPTEAMVVSAVEQGKKAAYAIQRAMQTRYMREEV
ncbi:MAG: FAD-dependent oxidoreductase, partial [Bacillus sp. (in: Bacteria)]|nr:FAD-dependent oxidoreductase [Bacillus sp. (in: firmicutes)]